MNQLTLRKEGTCPRGMKGKRDPQGMSQVKIIGVRKSRKTRSTRESQDYRGEGEGEGIGVGAGSGTGFGMGVVDTGRFKRIPPAVTRSSVARAMI